MKESFETLSNMTTYFHEDVRAAVMKSCAQLVGALYKAQPPSKIMVGSFEVQQLGPDLEVLFDQVVVTYFEIMKDDDDKETCAQACEGLGELAKLVGAGPLEKHMEMAVERIKTLLQKKAPCQLAMTDEEEGDDDDEDHDEVLIDAVAECINSLGGVFKSRIEPHFRVLFPLLLNYCRPQRPASDRIMAVGTIAEAVNSMGAASLPYVQDLFPLCLQGIQDKGSDGLRRNSCYAIGLMCQNASAVVKPEMNNVLMALKPLFEESEEETVRDNACGAVARMMSAAPEAMPLAQVLPFFLATLPLRGDTEENTVCFRTLIQLLQSQNESLSPLVPTVLKLFGSVLETTLITDEVSIEIGTTLRWLVQGFEAQIGPVIQALPEAERAKIMQAVQGR